jgi:hypothetical protein
MTCDYCPNPAVWHASAESPTAGINRLACTPHVDQARRDCSAVGMPTVTETPAERDWSQLTEGSAA